MATCWLLNVGEQSRRRAAISSKDTNHEFGSFGNALTPARTSSWLSMISATSLPSAVSSPREQIGAREDWPVTPSTRHGWAAPRWADVLPFSRQQPSGFVPDGHVKLKPIEIMAFAVG